MFLLEIGVKDFTRKWDEIQLHGESSILDVEWYTNDQHQFVHGATNPPTNWQLTSYKKFYLSTFY